MDTYDVTINGEWEGVCEWDDLIEFIRNITPGDTIEIKRET